MVHFKKMYTLIENYKQFYLKVFFSINTSSIVNNAQSIFIQRYMKGYRNMPAPEGKTTFHSLQV